MSPVTTTIRHNTIANNGVGLSTSGNLGSITIAYNNIVSNTQYSITVNVANNWWGTTNQQAIAQMLGNGANFLPFLTEPDPLAPPIPNPVPTPMPSPVPTPTATPTPTPTPKPVPTNTPTPSPTPYSPSPTPPPTPTLTPTPSPIPTPTYHPIPSPSPTPSPTPQTTPTPTSTPNPTAMPTPQPSQNVPTLKVSCVSSTSSLNLKVDITGRLNCKETGIAEPTSCYPIVSFGNSWIDLTTVRTDTDGNFEATWNPPVTGYYMLKAVYGGDQVFSSVSDLVNFVISPLQEQSVFSVTSNSTITSLYFNSTSNQFSFVTSGASGTTGYVDLYFPPKRLSTIPPTSKFTWTKHL